MDNCSVLETAWGNFGLHLARFTSYKPLYNLALKTSALSAIASAKALPDNDARTGSSVVLRIGLVPMGRVCLQNFQFLKGYIETAYVGKDLQEAQLVIAGQNYYSEAGNEDWEMMISMNSSAKNYLAVPANVTALTAGNNMPATFVASQKLASDNFDLQYASFKLAEETSVETANKIRANNLCYHSGMQMLSDGQKIFMNEPDILVKFVYSNLLALINPAVAGIKGNIKEAVTNDVIANAKISAQCDGFPADDVPVDVYGDFGQQLK